MFKLAFLFGKRKKKNLRPYVAPQATVVCVELDSSLLVTSALGDGNIGGEDIIWDEPIDL